MSLFSAAIGRDSVSLLKFPFLRHVLVLSCDISAVCCSKYPCCYFSNNFCFQLIVVLLIFMLSVSGRLNSSFFALFYVVFTYWYLHDWNVLNLLLVAASPDHTDWIHMMDAYIQFAKMTLNLLYSIPTICQNDSWNSSNALTVKHGYFCLFRKTFPSPS